MTARLPQPGSDDGTWGNILNGFLTVAHNIDGTLQSGIITDTNVSATAAISRTKLDASTQASLNKADTALQSAPVTSVNAKTGAVSLTATDVGADAAGAAASAQAASLQIAHNLSDLNSVSTARTNLGLGGAATLNVGTTTGTVAAGDDSRLAAASTAVQSVNSKTGTSVSLTASDVGALATPATTWTKGAILTGTGTGTYDVTAVGADNTVLSADSTAASGLSWKTLQAGVVGSTAYASSVTLPTAMAALDTTNLTVTFTAPASGKVLLRASFEFINNGTYSSNVSSVWYTHGTTTAVTATQQLLNFYGSSTGGEYVANMRLTSEKIVTGLTVGQSYTYDLAAQNSNASTTASDFILTAWAV